MYQKEIIYMGLYKNGTRIGSAGFVKVESREQNSRLYLKTQNIPHNINGRFPIRVYNGSDWKEINGITIQDGAGVWEDELAGRANHAMLQVMLPGGYLLEGRSKSAAESRQSMETQRESDIQEKAEIYRETIMTYDPQIRNEDSMPGAAQRRNEDSMPGAAQRRNEDSMPGAAQRRNEDFMPGAAQRRSEVVMPIETEVRSEDPVQQNTMARGGTIMPEELKVSGQVALPAEAETSSEAVRTESMRTRSAMPVDRADRSTTAVRQDAKAAMCADEPQQTAKTPVVIVTEELPCRPLREACSMPENAAAYPLKEDKWEQILDTYEQIHPYGDERVYVKLEPKDFVILRSNYQHLVNNSFLLHGFYNYRYLILGKEQDYYLGVPGVFYEREKMVALMFGFEAFECPGGNVRAGEFGYYLRKVEL